jgi:hypothetical protein
MKKLNLDLDTLLVESFETSSQRDERGTVRGHGYTDTTCGQRVCGCPTVMGPTCAATCESCDGTCGEQTCAASCPDTCNDFCNSTGISCCNAPLSLCGACTIP